MLALWGFVDDHTFLTKAGALGVAYHVTGVDGECLDHAERRAIAHRFEQALRQLDESFRVYQYVLKRRIAAFAPEPHAHPVVAEALDRRIAYLNARRASLFELELYLVLVQEHAIGPSSFRARLGSL
ncbi:MAG: hypothetical protein ACRENC_19870, partial [Gemmatimonadaceae bacterium]